MIGKKEGDMEIIGLKEIMEEYGLPRKTATAYLNMRSCPTLPRVKNSPYRIIRESWEEWLRKVSSK